MTDKKPWAGATIPKIMWWVSLPVRVALIAVFGVTLWILLPLARDKGEIIRMLWRGDGE